MTILEIILIIISGALLFAITFIIKSKMNKNDNFNHLDALYSLETTEIIIDNFTAHRIRFDMRDEFNWRKYRNIELKYDKKTNLYALTITHISQEHKENTIKKLNLQ
jgi:hypothetical protein